MGKYSSHFSRAAAAWAMCLAAVFLLRVGLDALPGPAAQADAAISDVQDPPSPTRTGPKLIALTFDDGPRRSTTTALLDGLAERGVHVTFFLIGAQIEGNEDLVQRMHDEGHQIGIHTYDHVELTGLNAADFAAQVDKTRDILSGLVGAEDFLLRPPYGLTDANVQARAGAPIILWSIDPEDWQNKDAARESAHIVSHAQDGSIVLLHDIYPASVEAALQTIDQLHQQGYLFCTIEQLFSARHIPLEPGQCYREAYP